MDILYACLGYEWTVCDNIASHGGTLQMVLQMASRKQRHLMMNDKELEEWHSRSGDGAAITPRSPCAVAGLGPIPLLPRRGLDPYAYLRDILTRLPHATNRQIDQLTPRAWARQTQPFQRAA